MDLLGQVSWVLIPSPPHSTVRGKKSNFYLIRLQWDLAKSFDLPGAGNRQEQGEKRDECGEGESDPRLTQPLALPFGVTALTVRDAESLTAFMNTKVLVKSPSQGSSDGHSLHALRVQQPRGSPRELQTPCSHRKHNSTSLVPPSPEPETSDISAYELSLSRPKGSFQVVQPSSPKKEEHVRM